MPKIFLSQNFKISKFLSTQLNVTCIFPFVKEILLFTLCLEIPCSLESLQAIGQLYFEPYRRVIFLVSLAMCTTTYLQSRFRRRVLSCKVLLGFKVELQSF